MDFLVKNQMMITFNKKPLRFRTQYYPGKVDVDTASNLYAILESETDWQTGIKSRGVETRKAYSCSTFLITSDIDLSVTTLVSDIISKIDLGGDYAIAGIYLNYYRNGNDWTPNHRHSGTVQMIISLGATRTLDIASKSYVMENGDVIVFGSSLHGVKKDPSVTDGRISIAVFLQPITIQ